MNLGSADYTIAEPYVGNALAFPPTSWSIDLLQPGNLSNRPADRDRFNLADPADNVNTHAITFPVHADAIILRTPLSSAATQ